MFVEMGCIRCGRRTRFCFAGHSASGNVGGYTMVQHVIDTLLHQQTPTCMVSAKNFTLAGGEQAQSGTKVWLPLPKSRHRTVLCLRGGERSEPDLVFQRSTSPSNPADGDAFERLGLSLLTLGVLSEHPQTQVTFATLKIGTAPLRYSTLAALSG